MPRTQCPCLSLLCVGPIHNTILLCAFALLFQNVNSVGHRHNSILSSTSISIHVTPSEMQSFDVEKQCCKFKGYPKGMMRSPHPFCLMQC